VGSFGSLDFEGPNQPASGGDIPLWDEPNPDDLQTKRGSNWVEPVPTQLDPATKHMLSDLACFLYCSITCQARGYHGPFVLQLQYHLPGYLAGYGLWITTGLLCTLWVAVSYVSLSKVTVM
jgi:hypothetical protein